MISVLAKEPETKLKIMSFNMWDGGLNRNTTAQEYANFIIEQNIQIACLQETIVLEEDTFKIIYNTGKDIAKILGWNYYEQKTKESFATAIITPFEHSDIIVIEDVIRAVVLKVDNKKVLIINDHLWDAPYQPWEMEREAAEKANDIGYVKEKIADAYETRKEIIMVVNHIMDKYEELRNVPTFITGDFNEPSHLDWTREAKEKGWCPFEVEWPISKNLSDLGFVDSFRALYPDPISDPGLTWSVDVSDIGRGRYDRIDYIYFRNAKVETVEVMDSKISDHCAVIGVFQI